MIAGTEPKQAFVLSREPFDPSVARFGIGVQGSENAKGLLRDGSEFGGTFGSNRIFFTRFSFALLAADLIHGEAEMGNHVFQADASLGVLPEVLA